MSTRITHILIAACALFLASCSNTPSKNHGPIVLGDSSAIVTEDDPQKLKDLVTDLKPDIPPPSDNKDTAATPATAAQPVQPDTDKNKKAAAAPPQAPPPAQLPNTPGLRADFKEVSVLVANLGVKQAGNPNLHNANGAVYTLTGGNVNGTTIKVTGNVTKVSQRYQAVVMLKTDNGVLPLESLSNTTSWEPLKGGNGTYHITGLDAASLDAPDADGDDIRSAVTRAAQRKRMNHKKLQELLSSVHHARNVSQRPFSMTLRSVMWKIDGKDAQGKPFSKQIRVDVPM